MLSVRTLSDHWPLGQQETVGYRRRWLEAGAIPHWYIDSQVELWSRLRARNDSRLIRGGGGDAVVRRVCNVAVC